MHGTNAQYTLDDLLNGMARFDASDLHLKVGYPPYYRVAGSLRKVEVPPLESSERIEQMFAGLIPKQRANDFQEHGDLDFSYQGANEERFRVNLFRCNDQMHAAIRRVKSAIPSFEDLHLPPIYRRLMERTSEGLILIAGITGSGKSCTLAAMLDYVNEHRNEHIITIEDPVEFVFKPKKSVISQREIGLDIPDIAEALRFVVRQDPDVVFIGEMRDGNTMLAAIQAAETGHLVMGSIHCSDAPQVLSRILEYFPQDQHEFIRSSLSSSLAAVCCQKLLPAIDEKIGLVPATEVLLANSLVREKIRRAEDSDLPDIIGSSVEDGMRNFTYSLAELLEKEMVYFDVAMEYAPNREALQSSLQGIKTSGHGLVTRVKARR